MSWTPIDDTLLGALLDSKVLAGDEWSEEWMVADLRWHAGQVRAFKATGSRKYIRKIPGYRKMAERWNVRPHIARTLMASDWRVVKDENPRTSRAAPTQSPRTSRAVQKMDTAFSPNIPRTSNAEPAQSARTFRDTRVLSEDREQKTEDRLTVSVATPAEPDPPTDTSTATDEGLPPVPAWATKAKPRGCSPRQLAESVLLIASKVTRRKLEPAWAKACNWPHGEQGRVIKASSSKTLVAGVVALLRALDWPDLDEWVADASDVAWAFHKCSDPLFARDVRAEGWANGKNRSRSMKTFACQESWDDRVTAAQTARNRTAAAPQQPGPALQVLDGGKGPQTGATAREIAERLWGEYTNGFGGIKGRVARHGVTPELFASWRDMSTRAVPTHTVQQMRAADAKWRRDDYLAAAVPWVEAHLRGAA